MHLTNGSFSHLSNSATTLGVEVLMLWIKPGTVKFQAVKGSHKGLLGSVYVLAT